MTDHTETIANLRSIYREHLFTDEGKKQLADAIELKREWREIESSTDFQCSTAGIKTKFIPSCLKDKTTCITITPIGLNNMCHITSELFEKKAGIKRVLGFNITACPCGRMMTMEIHSVNKIGDTLYDFTRDFADEKSKYFVEVDTELTAKLHNRIYSADPITINKGCKCPIHWNNARQYLMSETNLERRIRDMESMIVEETPFGMVINFNRK